MNKTAIKNFAVWARNKLIADITYKAGLIGVSEKGIAQPLPQSSKDLQFFDIGTKDYAQVAGSDIEQRNALVRAIQEKESTSDYMTAFKAVVEEVAYTWFNRLIAIRFMEVNEYLPSRIRVLSSENSAKNEPDFVSTPFDTDMEFTSLEQDKIMQLKDENKLDELFRMLFIKQCNKLHEILPELFEETNNYTELLLSISFTDNDGIVYHLVHDIPEDDFNVEKEGQVEIIGWMYQYYNIEPKDKVFANLKKNIKISKENIPAATQLFTPDWIVRYMVENSLGRLWVEGHPSDSLKENWKYYLEEAEQEANVQAQLEQIRAEYRNLNPEDIKVIDPCMGSGHILVYCFDVLMQIYEAQGYTQRDAAQLILEKNLFGLDIDKRAAQLAYFAVMMKARQYDRRIFTEGIKPNLFAIEESNGITHDLIEFISDGNKNIETDLAKICNELRDAKEYGSILDISMVDFDGILSRIDAIAETYYDDIFLQNYQRKTLSVIVPLIKQAKAMAQKYDVVVTNPPYMPLSNAHSKLSDYVKDNYPDSKTDLFAVFIERCKEMLKKYGYQAMITMHSWMFLSSYEKLRKKLMLNDTVSMAHLGARAFEEIGGEVVQTTAFVRRNSYNKEYSGVYCRLVEPNTQQGKEIMYLEKKNRYISNQDNFNKIPSSPIAYWISNNVFTPFEKFSSVSDYAQGKVGLQTGNNDEFLRMWYEIEFQRITFEADYAFKWFPYNKGGGFRRWYGNLEYVLNWEDDGAKVKRHKGAFPRNTQFYFRKCQTWSDVATGLISMRSIPNGIAFDTCAPCLFSEDEDSNLLAFFNSKVAQIYMDLMSPTMHYTCGTLVNVPYVKPQADLTQIVESCIGISKCDWDSFETSWDFKKHPLV